MATAKAGDKITEAARKKYLKAMNVCLPEGTKKTEADLLEELVQKEVLPKGEGTDGQWFCIDCGAFPQNNLQAQIHERERPKHRQAWRSFVSGGKIEEP